VLTHAGIDHECDLSHVDDTKCDISHVEGILGSSHVSKQFYMGEEQFS
jgi:hypothetical protein